MKSLFLDYGIELTGLQEEKFEKYYELLIYYNGKFNLTAITEKKEVIIKHFIDSALGKKFIIGKRFIDIGAGGGFPSVPVKIFKEDCELVMVEATGKKCEFLKTVVKELDLKKTEVINSRAEDLAKEKEYRESFDHCVARAVARLSTLCEYCLPFVKTGGSFIAYKGDAEQEIREAERAVKILGGRIKTVENYKLGDAKRALIQIEKIRPTEKNYPRGNGKERKKPL